MGLFKIEVDTVTAQMAGCTCGCIDGAGTGFGTTEKSGLN